MKTLEEIIDAVSRVPSGSVRLSLVPEESPDQGVPWLMLRLRVEVHGKKLTAAKAFTPIQVSSTRDGRAVSRELAEVAAELGDKLSDMIPGRPS